MKAEHPSSSIHKAITPPTPNSRPFKTSRPLLATAVIGAALIAYLVHKTPDARERLGGLGGLSEHDAAVIANLIAKPTSLNATQGEQRYVF